MPITKRPIKTISNKMQQIGISRLHLPDGSIRHNQILVFDKGKLVKFFSLTKEVAFTKWIGGDYFIEEDAHLLY